MSKEVTTIDYRTEPQSGVAAFVATQVIRQLEQGKRVLLLLSGGSGGDIGVEASKLLVKHDVSNLFVTVSDERYGDVGHADENVQQLLDKGLTLSPATFYRPLNGKSLDETTADFAKWLTTTSRHVDYRIAILGIGEDGHTSGVKPGSTGVTSKETAVSFIGDDFTRITTTLSFLRTVDEAVVQAYGSTKHDMLRQLHKRSGDYPMQVIHDIPNVTLFSDYQKEEI